MTREFKVGMTGKTTKGFDYEIKGTARPGLMCATFRVEGSIVAQSVVEADGEILESFADEFGVLVHPEDAKLFAAECAQSERERVESLRSIDPHRFQAACAALTGLLAVNVYRGAANVAREAVSHGDALISRLITTKEGE